MSSLIRIAFRSPRSSTSPATLCFFVFFINDTATTQIYTLSLHDALPISAGMGPEQDREVPCRISSMKDRRERLEGRAERSEEHTSELQSLRHLVCRLLLEKKKKNLRMKKVKRRSLNDEYITETIKEHHSE